MSLYKAYAKIIKRNAFSVILYLVIGFAITIVFAASSGASVNLSAADLRDADIAVIVKDDSLKSQGIAAYLADRYNVKDIGDGERAIKDALFFGEVTYVAVIEEDGVSAYTVPNSTEGYTIASAIDTYLNTWQIYEDADLGLSQEEIRARTAATLAADVDVVDVSEHGDAGQAQTLVGYYNLFVYGVLCTIILGIGTVMMAMGEKQVAARTAMAPMRLKKRNAILYSSHGIFALVVYIIASLAGIYFAGGMAFSPEHLMLLADSFVFIICITSLGFLIGQLVRNANVFAGIANTLGLVLSFISGAFVPQYLLGDAVLTIAKFTPAYWYVAANDKILTHAGFDLSLISTELLMQLAFAAVFIIIGAMAARRHLRA